MLNGTDFDLEVGLGTPGAYRLGVDVEVVRLSNWHGGRLSLLRSGELGQRGASAGEGGRLVGGRTVGGGAFSTFPPRRQALGLRVRTLSLAQASDRPYLTACRLALYVYEYLLHVGAQKSAQTFLSEVSWPSQAGTHTPDPSLAPAPWGLPTPFLSGLLW